MNAILIRLKEVYGQLAPSEREVGDFILKNPKQTVQSSVKEIAKFSGSSEAAVIRLCKSLGLSGFSALKAALVDDLSEDKPAMEFEDAMPGDSIQKIIACVGGANSVAIRDTLAIVDPVAIEKAVDLLRNARRIECCGAGGSSEVAFDAYLKFLRIGSWVNWNQDLHLQLTSAALLNSKDVLLAVSYSGRTKETYEVAQMAKRRHAKIISITKYGDTPLGQLADVNLFVSAPESDLRSASTCSRLAELTIVDILFTGVISKDYDTVKSSLHQTRQMTQQHKLR